MTTVINNSSPKSGEEVKMRAAKDGKSYMPAGGNLRSIKPDAAGACNEQRARQYAYALRRNAVYGPSLHGAHRAANNKSWRCYCGICDVSRDTQSVLE